MDGNQRGESNRDLLMTMHGDIATLLERTEGLDAWRTDIEERITQNRRDLDWMKRIGLVITGALSSVVSALALDFLRR